MDREIIEIKDEEEGTKPSFYPISHDMPKDTMSGTTVGLKTELKEEKFAPMECERERTERRPSPKVIDEVQKLYDDLCARATANAQEGKRQIEELKIELQDKTRQVEELDRNFRDKGAKHKELNASLEEKERIVKELQHNLQESQREHHKLSTRLDKLQKSHGSSEAKMEATIEELREELQKGKAHLTDSTVTLEKNCEAMQNLRESLAASEREKQACQDDLFRLQPRTQVSDTEISQEFEELCLHIISWIDTEIETFEKKRSSVRFVHMFSAGRDPDGTQLLRDHPEAGEYLVRYRIHHLLLTNLFAGEVYLFGLPKDVKAALQTAEKAMTYQSPGKDDSTTKMWRSETLHAIGATSQHAQARDEELEAFTRHAVGFITTYFPIICQNKESKARFHKQIIIPAAKFEAKIHKAASMYRFGFSAKPCMQNKRVKKDELEGATLVDIKTRRSLRADSVVSPGKKGAIGESLMVLEPELFKINKNKERIRLRKRVQLIKLDQPVAKRQRG